MKFLTTSQWLVTTLFFLTFSLEENDISSRSSKINDFLVWFEDKGGKMFNASIGPSQISGYGIFATQDVNVSQRLLTMPFDIVISVEELTQMMKSKGADFFLVASYLAFERANGNESYWASYLGSFPSNEDYSSNPIYFPSEVFEFLQSSPYKYYIQMRQNHAQEVYAATSESFQEAVSYSDLLWGISALYSRAFEVMVITNESTQVQNCLWPMSDFLNTGIPDVVNIDCAIANKVFECYAIQNITAGEELLIPYNRVGTPPLDNGRMMMNHGFILHPNNRQHLDLYSIFIKTDALPERKQRKLKRLVKETADTNNDWFSILFNQAMAPNNTLFLIQGYKNGIIDRQMKTIFAFVRFYLLDGDMIYGVPTKSISKILNRNITFAGDIDEELTTLDVHVLAYILEIVDNQQLASYNTTLEEDEALWEILKDVTDPSLYCSYLSITFPDGWCNLKAIEEMLHIRMGEKRILHYLKKWLTELYDAYPPDFKIKSKKKKKRNANRKKKSMKRRRDIKKEL